MSLLDCLSDLAQLFEALDECIRNKQTDQGNTNKGQYGTNDRCNELILSLYACRVLYGGRQALIELDQGAHGTEGISIGWFSLEALKVLGLGDIPRGNVLEHLLLRETVEVPRTQRTTCQGLLLPHLPLVICFG